MVFVQDTNNIDCTINLTAFTIRREGDGKSLNTFIDNSNGAITVNAGQPIVTTVPESVFSRVAKTEELVTVNNNVINASKLIPASEDLPYASEYHLNDPLVTNEEPEGTRWYSAASRELFTSTGQTGTGHIVWNGNKGTKIITPYTNAELKQAVNDAIANGTPVNDICTTGVTDFSSIFRDKDTFNEPLDKWDTSSATSMGLMFYGCNAFNQDISSWDVSNVTNMSKIVCFNWRLVQALIKALMDGMYLV